MPRRAFTLIETVFILGILVMLIAILLPSLGRGRRLANQNKCSINLMNIGVGIAGYTLDHDKFYPHRTGVLTSGWRADQLSDHLFDVRPVISPYLPINSMNCPVDKGIADLSTATLDSAGRTQWVYADYFLYFGWRYVSGTERGMEKMDDRFTYKGRPFGFLASDRDAFDGTTDSYLTTHGDSEGATHQEYAQDMEVAPASGPLAATSPQPTKGPLIFTGESGPTFFADAPAGTLATFSWMFGGGKKRGTVSMNVLHADGTVQTYHEVTAPDPRMTQIPLTSDDHLKNWGIQVPNR